MRKKLRKIQPDLIHAQGTERDCAISAIFTPYPKLLTIHGNLRLIRQTIGFRPLSAMWFQTFIEGFVVPRFDGVVCITNYTKKAIEHEAKKTWVIPNAVDPAFLSLGEERQIKDRRSDIGSQPTPTSDLRPPSSTIPAPIVLVVANVDARKNQSNFILALDALAKKTPFQAKFFGRCSDDDYGREFHRLVSERTWCQYGGMISRDELRREFASATVLALPTHEDNCPMVVLEAQAAAIPVMASNVGGVPDLVENEVTGLLTDPNRPESMSAALQRLLQEPALVNDLARNGRLQAQQRFHPEVIAAAHLEIYAEVIASQRK
ncbi:MAG: glycosyltransferase family 4 protein [Verrucomicrobiota bacterium]